MAGEGLTVEEVWSYVRSLIKVHLGVMIKTKFKLSELGLDVFLNSLSVTRRSHGIDPFFFLALVEQTPKLTREEVCARLGVERPALFKKARQYGIPLVLLREVQKGRVPRISDTQLAQDLTAGLSLSDIARKYGLQRPAITKRYETLRKNGLIPNMTYRKFRKSLGLS